MHSELMESEMSESGSEPGSPEQTHAGPSKRKKTRQPRQPLRRGDACLMCRAKKLKCSATKPACDQCTKRQDRCVYDAIRPASRVEKLEKKLAEIEEADIRTSSSSRRHSDVAPPQQYKPYNHDPPLRPVLSSSMDSGIYMYGNGPSNGTSSYPGIMSYPERPDTASSMGTPVIGPGVVDAWAFNDPFAGSSATPLPNQAVQLDALPWPVLSSSNDVSTMWGSTPFMDDGLEYNMGPNPNINPAWNGSNINFDNLNTDPAQLVFPPPTCMASSSTAEPYSSHMDLPTSADSVIDDVLTHATTYTGIQLQESDISQSARDYLLDLFFCPPRIQAGSEPWSEAHFKSRMKSGSRQRAHPGLLFAMYTTAASSSYIPAVRALADSLYTIALQKVDEGIAQEDRLLDCINASKMLSKWLFSKARALEAYSIIWKAVSLVHACQLDKITTNKWSPDMLKGGRGQDNAWPLLGPPKGQWDLCERIHAFWGVWANARGASIMLPWPSPLRDETILTPLPYAPDDYLTGATAHQPDFSLRDLYESPYTGAPPPGYNYGLMMAALHLVDRAKATREGPISSQATFRELAHASSSSRSPRSDNPAVYREIMDAANNFSGKLPPSARIDIHSSVPWISFDVPMLLVCIVAVRMHLHDPEGDEYDRETCFSATKEAASIIKPWIRQLRSDDTKQNIRAGPKISSRDRNGVAGPYVLVPWFWTVNRLIRSAKVLKALGRVRESEEMESDAGFVVQGLKEQGVLYPLVGEAGL